MKRSLKSSPDVVTIGLIWDSAKPDVDHITSVMRTVDCSVHIASVSCSFSVHIQYPLSVEFSKTDQIYRIENSEVVHFVSALKLTTYNNRLYSHARFSGHFRIYMASQLPLIFICSSCLHWAPVSIITALSLIMECTQFHSLLTHTIYTSLLHVLHKALSKAIFFMNVLHFYL